MQKVLIVTYYWPPSAGGGVQRWLKLATHLPEFGIEPTIFTPEKPAFGLQDPSLLDVVPDGLEVWKFPIWEPLSMFGKNRQPVQGQVLEKEKKSLTDKIIIAIRAWFFIPDPRIFWVKPSIRFLLPMIKANKIEMVITTGPPHSMHLIGLGLKKKSGISWVADFRDPWSRWDILDKLGVRGWAKYRHRILEKKVLQNADLLITVSPSWEEDFKALGAAKSFVLTNGFDQESISDRSSGKGGRFVISHVGMLNEMRNPLALWKALAELCASDEAFNKSLEIFLAGIPSEKVVGTISKYPALAAKLRVAGYLSHTEARAAMQESSLLLLVMNDSENAKGHIPGKLFEYLAAKRPILAIGDPNGDSAGILAKTKAGKCLAFGDEPGFRQEIADQFGLFVSGTPFKAGDADQYNRRNLAKKLAFRLKEVMSQKEGQQND